MCALSNSLEVGRQTLRARTPRRGLATGTAGGLPARHKAWLGLCLAVVALATLRVQAQEEFALSLQPGTNGWELRWQIRAKSGQAVPRFEVQQSADCVHWTPVASGLTSEDGVLRWSTGTAAPAGFYRVASDQEVSATASGGEEVFGYARAFRQQLARLGALSLDAFAARYPTPTNYLDGPSFDITKALYWDRLASGAVAYDVRGWDTLPSLKPNAAEQALVQRNGFVVSERLSYPTCVGLYYSVFRHDLPVFVTSDSILQAWHQSFDGMLAELETTYLSASVAEMLQSMATEISSLWPTFGQGPLRQSLLDADYFVTVGRSLLAGSQKPSGLGQDAAVTATLQAVASLQAQPIDLFGRLAWDPDFMLDFSQFKPRGHYADTELLQRYFRAMMWCGFVDLRIAGLPTNAPPRELGTALVLTRALRQSGQWTNWAHIDRLLEVLVGRVDSLTFAQLDAFLPVAPVRGLEDVQSEADLIQLQRAIEQGQLGFQEILSGFYSSAPGGQQIRLPRSFTVLGQRFALDSWAFRQVVFDQIYWPDRPGLVPRRIPSGLDAAFAVFGNSQIVPELIARMSNPNGRRFRDGLPYQHNLAAAREVIDAQPAAAWSDSVYTLWLAALRELSAPTTAAEYPECMRTRPWALKSLNTQLASWTHLRHDTILYVKQSYTPGVLCSYPKGFVEPVPAFWRAMNSMATRAADLIDGTPMRGLGHRADRYGLGVTFDVDLATVRSNQVAFLNRFAATMRTLETMAAKELAQEPFSTNETVFLQDVVEKYVDYFGTITYSGWYPKLYYLDNEGFDAQSDALGRSRGLMSLPRDVDKWDALVADVHTDSPDDVTGDPGMVLHEAVGNVNCLIAAVDSGPDRAIYVGPVLSHYEFERPTGVRLSDQEWKDLLNKGLVPPTPDWTQSYLAP